MYSPTSIETSDCISMELTEKNDTLRWSKIALCFLHGIASISLECCANDR
eukprot:m.1449320 g.1449320  ORF g.1449320 m.1449320 type:complete len:50 (-) comp25114_c0_seq3:1470-1619(-)